VQNRLDLHALQWADSPRVNYSPSTKGQLITDEVGTQCLFEEDGMTNQEIWDTETAESYDTPGAGMFSVEVLLPGNSTYAASASTPCEPGAFSAQ